MRLTLEDVAARLDRDVHAGYRSFVLRRGIDTLHDSLAAPAQVCALNLEERSLNESGPTSCGFVLYGQGDGNFFVLPDGTDGALAQVWSHESEGLTDSAVRALELLEQMAATPIPEVQLEPGNYLLSRVTPFSQAILNPVTPQEVVSVAELLSGLEYFDQLEPENPFTHEPIYFKAAGLLLSDRGARLDLRSGALLTRNWSPEDVDLLAKVAEHLGCHVFPSLPARVTANNRWRGP